MLQFTLRFCLTLFFLSATVRSETRASDDDPGLEKKAQPYDVLTLTQSWPQTSCWSINKFWPDEGTTCSRCKMPKAKESWTLHGLWPSNSRGKHPAFCDDEMQYNPKLLSSSMRTQMTEKWPSMQQNKGNDAFWKHEWTKHGTCALDLEAMDTMPKYFAKSLKMLDQYNLGPILSESGIRAGATYRLDDIYNVIESSLGVRVNVKCATNTSTKQQYLNELSLCFDKSFQLTDCSTKNTSNCRANAEIVYPKALETC